MTTPVIRERAQFPNTIPTSSNWLSNTALAETFIRTLIQVEIAKEMHERILSGEAYSHQLADLDSQVKHIITHMLAERQDASRVQYVFREEKHVQRRIRRATILFSGIGLTASIVFATLLALSGLGLSVIHPLISLIGMVGGLGWVVTAWADFYVKEQHDAKEAAYKAETETSKFQIA